LNKEQQIHDPSKLHASAGFSTSVKVGCAKLTSSEKAAVVTIHSEVRVGTHFGITLQHTKPVRTFKVKDSIPTRTIPQILTGLKPVLTNICTGIANDLINRSKAKIKIKENMNDNH